MKNVFEQVSLTQLEDFIIHHGFAEVPFENEVLRRFELVSNPKMMTLIPRHSNVKDYDRSVSAAIAVLPRLTNTTPKDMIRELGFYDKRTLFISETGSVVFGMKTPKSDLDLQICYQYPTVEILTGEKKPDNAKDDKSNGNDIHAWEIGHFIHNLMKGGVTALLAAISPLVVEDKYGYLADIKSILDENPCANFYRSIRGFAFANVDDCIHKNNARDHKRVWTAARQLQLGIDLLENHVYDPKPVSRDVTVPEVREMFNTIDKAYENTTLPKEPNREVWLNYLRQVRLNDLSLKEAQGDFKPRR